MSGIDEDPDSEHDPGREREQIEHLPSTGHRQVGGTPHAVPTHAELYVYTIAR
jgi:hypothetical protein